MGINHVSPASLKPPHYLTGYYSSCLQFFYEAHTLPEGHNLQVAQMSNRDFGGGRFDASSKAVKHMYVKKKCCKIALEVFLMLHLKIGNQFCHLKKKFSFKLQLRGTRWPCLITD